MKSEQYLINLKNKICLLYGFISEDSFGSYRYTNSEHSFVMGNESSTYGKDKLSPVWSKLILRAKSRRRIKPKQTTESKQSEGETSPKIAVQGMWITSDNPGVPRITQITLDYSGLLRITADQPELIRIIPNYSHYPGLLVRITKWSSGLPKLFPPLDYNGLLRITSQDYQVIRRINTVVSPSELPPITSDYSHYPGTPIRITKWSSALLNLFLPRDYRGLRRITCIIPDYQFGLPSDPGD